MGSKNGLKELAEHVRLLSKIYPKSIERFAIQETEILKDEIVKRTPVDTGRLRAGFHSERPTHDGNSWKIKVTNNVEYAEYVEYGHRWVKRGFKSIKLADYNPETDKTGFTKGRFMARDGLKATREGQQKRYSGFVQKIFERVIKGKTGK